MENKIELTLLSEGQIFDHETEEYIEAIRRYNHDGTFPDLHTEEQLEVMKKVGPFTNISDLCIVTGSYESGKARSTVDLSYNGGGMYYSPTATYWTRSSITKNFGRFDKYQEVNSINTTPQTKGYDAYHSVGMPFMREPVIRPVLKGVAPLFGHSYFPTVDENGVCEVEFGEYPQQAASEELQQELERQFVIGLPTTGNSYTLNGVDIENRRDNFVGIMYDEYEYQGNKYIRVLKNSHTYFPDSDKTNNQAIKAADGEPVWIQVSPVKWLLDKKSGLLIAKDCLLSGIRFDRKVKYKGKFEKTEMYQYLNKYMIRDLLQSAQLTKNDDYLIDEEKSHSYGRRI